MSNMRPNILYVMSDDHAAHAISAYRGHINQTPHLDRLANEGMRLDNCFCTNSLCTPSRAAILTGTYSHINGVCTLDDSLDRKQQNFAALLQEAGYHTGVIGKWHLKTEPRGFDYYNVLPGQGDYFNPRFKEKGRPWQDHEAGGDVREGYVTDLTTDYALQFMEDRPQDRPFCLLYQHKAPHDMWEYDALHAHIFEDGDVPEPDNLFDDYANRGEAIKRATQKIGKRHTLFEGIEGHEGQFRGVSEELKQLPPDELKRRSYQYFIKAYLRCIASIDDNMGRVLDYLDENGLAEDTIVIYTSDQGFFLGDHGLFDKRFMYEESLRMPFLIRYPKAIAPGIVNEDLVLNVDFAPTLLDYAGVSIPERMQGQSARRVLEGKAQDNWRDSLYYRYWMHRPHFDVAAHYGVRTKRYKLIFYYGLPLNATGAVDAPTPPEWELFDLDNDPCEMCSVYDDLAYAEVVDELKAELLRLKDEVGDRDEQFPELMKLREQCW
jgi:arylsulfatase A-like enzyme